MNGIAIGKNEQNLSSLTIKKNKQQLRISQSLIKEFDKPNTCLMYVKLHMIDGLYQSEPNDAMRKGIFFEYLALGNTAKGDGEFMKYIDLPKLRNGEPSVDEQRIRNQADLFKKLLELYNISIIKTRTVLNYPLDDYTLSAEFDALGIVKKEYNGNIVNVPVIIDTKLTKNIYSEFGEYSWGKPDLIDHIQAQFYPYILDKVMSGDIENETKDLLLMYDIAPDIYPQFYYMVFDYKPKMEYVIYNYVQTEMRIKEAEERIRKVYAGIDYFNQTEWPYNPTADNCNRCGYASECPFANRTKPIINI